MSISSSRADSMMMYVELKARIWRATSKPSMPGRLMSSVVRMGSYVRTAAMPSAPDSQVWQREAGLVEDGGEKVPDVGVVLDHDGDAVRLGCHAGHRTDTVAGPAARRACAGTTKTPRIIGQTLRRRPGRGRARPATVCGSARSGRRPRAAA